MKRAGGRKRRRRPDLSPIGHLLQNDYGRRGKSAGRPPCRHFGFRRRTRRV